MLEEIGAALLPGETSAMEAECFVVVDLLRATTTITAALAHGARSVVVVDSVERAKAMARERGAMLAGEIGGLPPEGFDAGNSPLEMNAASIGGREVVLFTTNGTRALCGIPDGAAGMAASLVNASAVARFLATAYRRAVLVCAGERGGSRFAFEDAVAASVIIKTVQREIPSVRLDDGALAALRILGADEPEALVQRARHAAALRKLGLEDDIAFACRVDALNCVPRVEGRGPGWALLRDAVSAA